MKERIARLQKRYRFRWEFLDAIVGGKSLIDTPLSPAGFSLRNAEDADDLLRAYGYNLEDPIERAEVFGNFHEALNFVRKNFLQPENPDGLKLEIPRKILECTDIRDLLLMVGFAYPGQRADVFGAQLRDWACSLLKVMHVIAHLDKDIRTSYFTEIQKQILDRFYRCVQRDETGQLYLGIRADDALRVDLIGFESKPKKSRDSMLLKLLHKPENAAEELFDRVGIRLITRTRVDALRVIKLLKDEHLIMPANIKPSRSRNTLLDLERARRVATPFLSELEKETITEDQFLLELENALKVPEPQGAENPHTSQHYRSLQFTARHLVKLTNPLYDDLKSLKTVVKSTPGLDEAVRLRIEALDLKYVQKEVRFFYPYEVQIVDNASHEENQKGRSSHSEYKRAQVLTALKRVMGNLA